MTRRWMRATVGACATLLAFGVTGTAQAAPQIPAEEPVVTFEKGHMVSCAATVKGHGAVNVALYDNSLYGNHAEVVVGEDEQVIAGTTQPAKLFHKKTIRAKVPLSRIGGDEAPVGSAVISGHFSLTGTPTPYRDEFYDDGMHIVTTGSHHQMSTRLTVKIFGQSARLECDTARAYDLRITKTPI
jgi:hypothetical protein